jgi:hypothetical protein
MDMQKWIAVLLVVIASAGDIAAQRVPDEDDILSKTMSSDSPYYYPAMMIRYLTGDEALTDEDYYYLYYGYAYDDSYDAHATLPGENRMLEIFAQTELPSKAQAQVMLEAAKENMAVDPFNPGNVNMMTFAYSILGDTVNEIISADRFNKIIRAIESSGTGLKETSPWHVLRFTHANDVVAAKGYEMVNRQVRTSSVEYIQLAKNPDKIKGLFFDFGRVYWKPYEGERPKRKNNWMFNGIPLGGKKEK